MVPETVEEEEEEAQSPENITPEPIPSLGGTDGEEDIPTNVEANGAEQQTPKGETKIPPPDYYGDKGWESHYNWINILQNMQEHSEGIHCKEYRTQMPMLDESDLINRTYITNWDENGEQL